MTTVFRLPEEPPVGTTVRPDPDTGERYVRSPAGGWALTPRNPSGIHFGFGWGMVLDACKGGVAIVEPERPDPHPVPWQTQGVIHLDMYVPDIVDANGESIYIGKPATTAARIVKAVNEANP